MQSGNVFTSRSVSPRKPNLLKIDTFTDEVWFQNFIALSDPLAQLLLLVALLADQNMITHKEATQFKRFLMNINGTVGDNKNREIVATFLRTGSLWSFRSDMRGRLGMPRMRCNDSFNSSASKKREVSPVSKTPSMHKKFSF